MSAPDEVAVTAAATWATTVSRRRYRKRRHELDALVVGLVPSYRQTIDDELQHFAEAVEGSRERYDARHSGAGDGRRPPSRVALFWTGILGVVGAFAVMFPVGGRSGGAAEIEASVWQYLVILSSALFTLGVVADMLHGLPSRPGIPPGKGLAGLPITMGVPTIALMVWRVDQGIGVDVVWVVVTAAALAVSVVHELVRRGRRKRDPKLTKQVDGSEDARRRALRDLVHQHAEQHAERITRAFEALPPADRDRLTRALDGAARALRDRGFILTPNPRAAKMNAHAAHRFRWRKMVPGLLLLEHKAREVWHPKTFWSVSEFAPQPRSSRR
jgi:hypothetical protein